MTIFTGQTTVPVSCDTASERADIKIMLRRIGVRYEEYDKKTTDGRTLYCLDVFMNHVTIKP